MKKAIYPGSFDPITFGHLDIIFRSAGLFDEVVVAVLNNSSKKSLFSAKERIDMIEGLVLDYPNVKVETFDGLLVDFARAKGINFVIRGLRTGEDFDYELQIAQANRVQYSELDTVFFAASLDYSYLSSTIAREFASYGGDISKYVPKEIVPVIEKKIRG